MPLLVVGSIAFDTIKTPAESASGVLGGSAVHFALAASFLSPVRLVGVVGDDFPPDLLEPLRERGIDTAGLEVVRGGRTFRWSGEYLRDMNQRRTLAVELNVLESFQPRVPESYRDSEFIFLANGPVQAQLEVLDQIRAPRFVMADTMDLWIRTQPKELLRLLERVDGVILNDEEALLLTGARHIIEAGRKIIQLGPERVVVKKGEHGAILFTPLEVYPLPAFPVHDVRDPTGAGDSFAGGLMGHLSRRGTAEEASFRAALGYGIVLSSLCVEDIGVGRFLRTSAAEVEERFRRYRDLLRLEP